MNQWAPAVPLPPFDPVGLPAPPALILALTYPTFTLHLLAVNFTLGSVLLNLWTRRAHRSGHTAGPSVASAILRSPPRLLPRGCVLRDTELRLFSGWIVASEPQPNTAYLEGNAKLG